MGLAELHNLPLDVLALITSQLTAGSLLALGQTSRSFAHFAENSAWPAYLAQHARYSPSTTRATSKWSAKRHARYLYLNDKGWDNRTFIARPLPLPLAARSLTSFIQLSPSWLVVGAGSDLYVHELARSTSGGPRTLPARTTKMSGATIITPEDPAQDIRGLVFLPDGGRDRTMCIARANGELSRISITASPTCDRDGDPTTTEAHKTTALYSHRGSPIESLTSSGNTILTLSASGLVSMYNAVSPWASPSTIRLPRGPVFRAWSAHINLHASNPYVAIGTASPTPLVIYDISSHGELEATPSAVLAGVDKSAVYGICRPPDNSSFSSHQVIVSGWYDGKVRIHDLRVHSRTSPSFPDSSSSPPAPTPLKPVLTLDDGVGHAGAVYSVSAGGGSNAHIVAGTAQHGIVSIWDMRSASVPVSPCNQQISRVRVNGWGVLPPGLDWCPTHQVIAEGSRIWGASSYGPFVLDFAPDVERDTYPPLHQGYGIEQDVRPGRNAGARQTAIERLKEVGLGYHATVYDHGDLVRVAA